MRSSRSHPERARAPRTGATLTLGLALAVATLFTAPREVRADDACEVEGTLGGVEVVVRERRGLRRVRLREPRRVGVTPLRSGVVQVRVLEGPPITGLVRGALRFVLARSVSLRDGVVELPEGLPLSRVAPAPRGPWAVVDASLGDGLELRGASLPCEALRVVSDEAPLLVPSGARVAHGPLWRARSARLWLFGAPEAREGLRIDVGPDASARFAEIARRGPWVQLVLRTALGARFRAWARDGDLVR